MLANSVYKLKSFHLIEFELSKIHRQINLPKKTKVISVFFTLNFSLGFETLFTEILFTMIQCSLAICIEKTNVFHKAALFANALPNAQI
jgi:hypothetical protein